jgi:hypothetical protein
MQDLYKRLGLDDAATVGEVHDALAAPAVAGRAIDSEMRAAAELVLLDPRRRAVYDRNRQVLVTIGQLRARLGLNLKPFWSRGRFGDFSYPFGPAVRHHPGYTGATHPPQDPLADPRTLWRAFGGGRRRGSNAGPVGHGPPRLGLWLAAAAVLALCLVAALLALRAWG